MSLQDSEKNALFHTRLAREYDACMEKHPGNAWVRAAFRQLVTEHVPPGSLLLDFGCGTGTDCLWYAKQGYRVLAFDNAPGMMAELERKCAREIFAGRVVPIHADYDHFPQALQRQDRVQAVVSNFAALNHNQDLRPLFSHFAAQLAPSGKVIISVLNPLFWQDVIHPWWWKALLRGFRRGYISPVSDDIRTFRHFIGRITDAAQPHFVKAGQAGVGTLLRYGSGTHMWTEPRTLAEKLDVHLHRSFPLCHLGKFIFLVLRESQPQL